jgi:hypothetical protein
MDVHAAACIAVAHLKTRDVMVIDRVVHPESTMLRQTLLFVSAPYKKAKKIKHPRQTTNRAISRAVENLPRRDTSLERMFRGRLLSIGEKLLLGWLSFT